MTPKIFESEYRFCLILWEHEPIKSTDLAKLCKRVPPTCRSSPARYPTESDRTDIHFQKS